MKITFVDNIHSCQEIWQEVIPADNIFNLWEVRQCFQRHYNHRPGFLVARKNKNICGLIALSEISQYGYWGCFPGETWKGKTWLEQNQIIYDSTETLSHLLDSCPPETYMRYLHCDTPDQNQMEQDETGYLFFPSDYDYDYQKYLMAFSGKSRKKLLRLVEKFEQQHMDYRFDAINDLNLLMEMNISNFGEDSYFADQRFANSFIDLAQYLKKNGWLRIVTFLVEGNIAGIDIASVYANQYTLMAGGTNRDFPGIAKFINLHHIEWACNNKMKTVDFLCGDFGWKENFHLKPRPLYKCKVNLCEEKSHSDMERLTLNAI